MYLSKSEFDNGVIIGQLPEGYKYRLDSWDIMGEDCLSVEGRVKGDMDKSYSIMRKIINLFLLRKCDKHTNR